MISRNNIKVTLTLLQKLTPFNKFFRICENTAFNWNQNHHYIQKSLKLSKVQNKISYIVYYKFFNDFSNTSIYIPLKKGDTIYSLESFFKSQTWAERELSEMFGIQVKDLSDSRKLLLDYGAFITPLNKNNSGLSDLSPLYYNINQESIQVSKNSGTLF